MKSPFKFLDAYALEDKEVFFGRDEEVAELYDMVFKSPMILVYGLSGTGKTSLIQCGLASRFDGPDWYPFFIRRNSNINESLDASLQKALGDQANGSLVNNIRYLFRYYLRPVYLIFDQFEELFILGDKDEQKLFLERLRQLQYEELPCKVLFVMREEYIGHLYQFEKVLPNIFNFRLRVESMNNIRVKEIIEKSFNKFNIHQEPPKEEQTDLIIDNLSLGRAGIQLPYLQVYLDTIYRETYAETFVEEQEVDLPTIVFTKGKIDELGNIEDVLEKFLITQISIIQKRLEENISGIQDNYVRNLLDIFVTEDGTKQPIFYTRGEDLMVLSEKSQLLLTKPNEKATSFALDALETARILRIEDNTIELAHDSLAKLIDRQRTEEQQQLNEIRRRIRSAYLEYQRTEFFLGTKQLNAYEEFLAQLNLKKEEWDFIENSKKHVARLEEQERNRQKREQELQRINLEAENKLKRRKQERRFTVFLGLMTLVAVTAGLYAFRLSNEAEGLRKEERVQRLEAEKKSIEADEQRELADKRLNTLGSQIEKNAKLQYGNHLDKASTFITNLEFANASNELEAATESYNANKILFKEQGGDDLELSKALLDRKKQLSKKIAHLGSQLPFFKNKIEEGKTLANQNEYIQALNSFIQAQNTGISSTDLMDDIDNVKIRGSRYYQDLADVHMRNGTKAGCIIAKEFLEKAEKLSSSSINIDLLINNCFEKLDSTLKKN